VSFDGNFFYLLILLLPSYLLVIGPTGPLHVVFILGQAGSFSFVSFACNNNKKTPTSWFFLWATICYHSYFITGHQNTFTSLQNAAGFIGFDEFYFYFAGILLGFNTFGNYAIFLSNLPLVAFHFQRQHRWIDVCHDWWRCVYTVILYFSLNCCVSMIFVAIERHHLMAWAIFAPKFIFDGITLILVEMLLGLFSFIALKHFR
jgi:phosphatidylinositol glycan class O